MGSALWARVDISSLVSFRVTVGVILLWEVVRYWRYDWIQSYWIEPEFNFPYPLFEWVVPWPGDGMFLHFAVLALASLGVMLGAFYRASITVLFLGFTYVFLLEEARYLNHFYLVALLLFLLTFLPAHRAGSVDARLRPSLRSDTAPGWTLWLLRFQIGVPYFYGALAKLNRDWLVGEPLRGWLPDAMGFPVIGRFFDREWMVVFFTYSGLALDLLAVPLLLWSRTRIPMFAALVLFHFINAGIFSIGIFPWLMIPATLVFFPPAWPRLLWEDLWTRPSRRGFAALIGALAGSFTASWFLYDLELVPFLVGALAGAIVLWSLVGGLSPARLANTTGLAEPRLEWPGSRRLIALGLATWVVFQSLIPLRHTLIPGNVSWTEEGHRFAWHMKLRDKEARARFIVVDPGSGERSEVNPAKYLTMWQVSKMSTRPYMIRQFAHHLAGLSIEGAEVYVRVAASLNGREPQPLIDLDVDLAAEPISWWKADWILPLEDQPPSMHPKPGT